ncbi:DUF3592 domain-containing protein [Shewanella sp. Isolate8]|uniref:DUF3592 domain-containing protein n=1 Tax=Shewanella sp. Isolate8 TaxID=2908529 RepID=UPI001EFE9491|nr:DUF3592 domain-containing protein [Shewanella sp. Isolate8]MCG9745225.1 DUF3592 domain-containing protein [Shewanella sp. Isolate8]
MDKQHVLVSLVITALILFGAALSIRGGLNSYQSLLSYGWQETQAKVLTNHIGRFHPSGARHGTDFYLAQISYSYRWQGVKYHGQLLYPDYSGDRTEEDAEARLVPYGVGQQVPVYVDPDDPRQSQLIRGVQLQQLGDILLGLAIILFGLWSLRIFHRR